MFEVVNYAFSVEKVHRGSEEIPIERSGEGKILCSTRYMRNGDDLLEGNDLKGRNDANYVYMA